MRTPLVIVTMNIWARHPVLFVCRNYPANGKAIGNTIALSAERYAEISTDEYTFSSSNGLRYASFSPIISYSKWTETRMGRAASWIQWSHHRVFATIFWYIQLVVNILNTTQGSRCRIFRHLFNVDTVVWVKSKLQKLVTQAIGHTFGQ